MRKYRKRAYPIRQVTEIKEVDREKIARIVRRAKKGEQKAFVELYEESYQDIYQFIFSIVKDTHATDDILQETYISAFKSLGTLKDDSAFFSWLCTIAYHASVKTFKKQKQRQTSEYDDFDVTILEDEKADPESAFIANEQNSALRQAIDELPEEQRVCVESFYYNNVPVKEIAKIVGCTENTVKSRLRLARTKLKTILEERSK